MSLTTYLQDEFKRNCPPGWKVFSEVPLLSQSIEQLLGFSPRVDVLLESVEGARRYWIEFEISRADPVANHAKFATVHLFQPQSENDIFFSMVSSHVTRGRHNLAASTIFLMRRVGMQAFQTVLFPDIPPNEIKRLNHLPKEVLQTQRLNVKPEIDRVVAIAQWTPEMGQHQISFAANYADVTLNIYRWNEQVSAPYLRLLWGKRTVTYFVFYPQAGLFAPSKFCAFVPADSAEIGMNMNLYCALDESETRFDGTVARKHLVNTLGMLEKKPVEVPKVNQLFLRWFERLQDLISIHPRGYSFILPPEWYL